MESEKKLLDAIVEGKGVNTVFSNSMPILLWVAQAGRIDIVRYLVEQGADPNVPDKYGNTALDIAEIEGFKKIADIIRDAQTKAASTAANP